MWMGHFAAAQEFVNGNVETNTGSPNTDYLGLTAPEFEAMVPNAYSSGISPNIDLITNFWNIGPQDGDWYLGITPHDLLTLELTDELVAGSTYTLTFYDMCKEIAFPIEIGVTDDPHAFGDGVYTTPQGALLATWTERTFTFTAPGNGRYISVRQQFGDDPRAWAGIDNFVMVSQNCNKTVDAGPDRVLCPGQPLVLTAGGSAFTTYAWSDQSTAQTLTVTEPGTYWVIGTQGICSDSDTVVVGLGELPEAVFEADRTEGCAPLEVTFTYTGHAQPGDTYAWTTGDGNGPVAGVLFTHVYTQAPCYTVSLTITSAQGCVATRTLTDYVCVHTDPVAAFTHTPEPVFVDHPQVQFMNGSTGHVTGEWQFGDGTISTDENPQHTYALGQGNDYIVQLIVTSELGCTDTAWDTVTVKYPFGLFVPNAFTPDGDIYNPTFTPIAAAPFDVEEYRLEIYDRWGTRIFSSTALTYGWDGSINGQTVTPDTYVWKITARDPYTHRQVLRTGLVSVVE